MTATKDRCALCGADISHSRCLIGHEGELIEVCPGCCPHCPPHYAGWVAQGIKYSWFSRWEADQISEQLKELDAEPDYGKWVQGVPE
jgi:hypothetical protein